MFFTKNKLRKKSLKTDARFEFTDLDNLWSNFTEINSFSKKKIFIEKASGKKYLKINSRFKFSNLANLKSNWFQQLFWAFREAVASTFLLDGSTKEVQGSTKEVQ